MNLGAPAEASLMLLSLIAAASARCADCAMHPDRDHFKRGALTPLCRWDDNGLQRRRGVAWTANGPAGVRDQLVQESQATRV